jgi:hypothetical protein
VRFRWFCGGWGAHGGIHDIWGWGMQVFLVCCCGWGEVGWWEVGSGMRGSDPWWIRGNPDAERLAGKLTGN